MLSLPPDSLPDVRSGRVVRDPEGRPVIQFAGNRAWSELTTYQMACRLYGENQMLVPRTAPRGYEERLGKLVMIVEQEYVPGVTWHAHGDLIGTIHTSVPLLRSVAELLLLDLAMQIGDRHEENLLLTRQGSAWTITAVDNEIGDPTITAASRVLRPLARTLLLDDAEHLAVVQAHIRRLFWASGSRLNRDQRLRVQSLLQWASTPRVGPCPLTTAL